MSTSLTELFFNALLSVSDKSGLLELAKGLSEAGVRLIGSGGTAKVVRESGLTIECASSYFTHQLRGF